MKSYLEVRALKKTLITFWVTQEATWSIVKLSRRDLLCAVSSFVKSAVRVKRLVRIYFRMFNLF